MKIFKLIIKMIMDRDTEFFVNMSDPTKEAGNRAIMTFVRDYAHLHRIERPEVPAEHAVYQNEAIRFDLSRPIDPILIDQEVRSIDEKTAYSASHKDRYISFRKLSERFLAIPMVQKALRKGK